MLPYANIEAYKEIQRRLADGSLQPLKAANKSFSLEPSSSSRSGRNRNSSSTGAKRSKGPKSQSFSRSRSSDSVQIQASRSDDNVMMVVDEDIDNNDNLALSRSTDYRKANTGVVYIDD